MSARSGPRRTNDLADQDLKVDGYLSLRQEDITGSKRECLDAADEEAVAKIVTSLQALRPVRGVVHAAMVLKVSTTRLSLTSLCNYHRA